LFNTGLNYTESLGDGEVLNRYFRYFGILDKLKLKQLDTDAFNKISFDNDRNEYPMAQGHDNFVERLSAFFPESKTGLKKYISSLETICNSFPLYTLDPAGNRDIYAKSLSSSAYGFLKSSFPGNGKLQGILSGMNPLYSAVADKTPLYIFALINYSFITSAWRLVDGGSQLASAVVSVIKENGGEVYLSREVVAVGGDNRQAGYVELSDGSRIYAEKIISNIHPVTTLKMVDKQLSKKVYGYRINSLENSTGMFTVYISLKDKSFPYLNFNHHHYSGLNNWTIDYDENRWPEHYYLYTPATSKSDKWADGLIVMTYMKYSEVEKWENTTVGNRGAEYLDFKRKKAEKLIDKVEEKFPEIRKSIKSYYTSTPLTYRDYTGTYKGSSYGILKDYHNPYVTILTPKTRIKNLYFTGQNLNMHGMLGVAIGAVTTCSEILGPDYLINKIKNA
jgi:all-trans-retinol 13,14-reductase